MIRKTTRFLRILLAFEAAGLDAIALHADTWHDDLDPEVSAQLVQTSAQASFPFGKDESKS